MVDYSPDWSFRQRAQAWLAAVAPPENPACPRAFQLGGERVLVLDAGHLSARQAIDACLLVRESFSCGAGCRFLQPVYIGGHGEIGKGSELDSIETNGSLTIQPAVVIHGWVHAGGELNLRAGCRIAWSASSNETIRLGPGAEAGRLFAPRILTPDVLGPPGEDAAPAPGDRWIIPPPWEGVPAGPGAEKFQPLGAETWVYDGDLYGPRHLWLRAHLVVQGAFRCAPNSLLEGDVQAAGALAVGEASVVQGNLSSEGDLEIGAGSVFQGDIHGRQRLRIGGGVRGVRASGPVRVRARGELLLEEGIMIRGELASGGRIRSVPARPAAWRREVFAATAAP